jgi:hypothetical protein
LIISNQVSQNRSQPVEKVPAKLINRGEILPQGHQKSGTNQEKKRQPFQKRTSQSLKEVEKSVQMASVGNGRRPHPRF